MTQGTPRERFRKLRSPNVAVRADQQRALCVGWQRRLDIGNVRGFDPRERCLVGQKSGSRLESRGFVAIEGNFKSAAAPVFDADARILPHAGDEFIEQGETADGEIEQWAGPRRFDVGRQDARGRLRRARANTTGIEDAHARTAPRELVCD